MIIGGSKKAVIDNIKTNLANGEYNKKVEINDPQITEEEILAILNKFFRRKEKKLSYYLRNKMARLMIKKLSIHLNRNIEIEGLENLDGLDLSKGAFITCNHFNPLDSFIPRKIVEKILDEKMYIVIQDTNVAMEGNLGYLMNNLDTIPINKSPNYINKIFIPELKKVFEKGHVVLIYPEEEMWFNYRKPRPCKRGTYQFASLLEVPIISLFTEMIDLDEPDNDEFNQVKYKVHILKPLYCEPTKSLKDNSIALANQDYEQKKQAYEKAYGKKLTYDFDYQDIAGWKKIS